MADRSWSKRTRTALAAAAVLIAGFAVSQTGLTSADGLNPTASSKVSAGDVLPRSADISANISGSAGSHRLNISVQNGYHDFDYRMFIVQDDGALVNGSNGWGSSATWPFTTQLVPFPEISAATINGTLPVRLNWDYTVKVYTVNRASGEQSDDWIGYRFRRTTAGSMTLNATSCAVSNCGPYTGTGLPGVTWANSGAVPLAASRMAPQSMMIDEELLEEEPTDIDQDETVDDDEGGRGSQAPSATETPKPGESDEGDPGTATDGQTSTPPTSTTGQADPTPTSPSTPTVEQSPSPSPSPDAPIESAQRRSTEIGGDPILLGDGRRVALETAQGVETVTVYEGATQSCSAEAEGATKLNVDAAGAVTVHHSDGRHSVLDPKTCRLD